jgi:hypothetical protein
MALKITGCNWFLDIVNYSLLMVSFIFAIVLIYFTDDDLYLYNNYKRNWSTGYITDVTFQQNECPVKYEKVKLGMWSGFNEGCYCKHMTTGDLWLKDSACTNSFSDAYTCSAIGDVPAVNLTEYRGYHFCVKRSQSNYFDIFKQVNDKLYPGGKKAFTNDREYFNITLKPTWFDIESAVTDIKLVNKEMQGLYKLDDYNAIYQNDTFGIFIKKRPDGTVSNYYELNDLIVDIHLYNYLWCSYLDIGAPDEFHLQLKGNTFGYSFCDDMNKQNSLIYNDGYKRTTKINTNPDASRDNFYSKEVKDSIQSQTGLTTANFIDNPMDPVLVYEKYFYGIGCIYQNNPNRHLDELQTNSLVRKLSIGTITTQVVIQFILVIYIFFKVKENTRLVSLSIFLILGAVGITLFFSITAVISARKSYNYFNDYDFWCQTDFRGHRYESSLEVDFKENLAFHGLLHLGLFFAQAIAGFFLILGFFNNCCCKPESDNLMNSSGLEMRMNSTVKQ